MITFIAVLTVFKIAVPAAAGIQVRPNFTGTWVQQRVEPSSLPPVTLRVFQDAETVTVDVGTPGSDAAMHYVFNLDGSQSRNTLTQGNPARRVVQMSRASWAGDKLEIATVVNSNREGPRTLTQSWSLSAGNLIVTYSEVNHRTGAVVRESRTVYTRQTAG